MTDEAVASGPGDQLTPAAALRASHADRDQVVEVLRIAAGDGRLTAEELDQRLDAALTARTVGELAVLTADLPAAAGQAATGPLPAARELARIDVASASASRDGRWVVPKRIEVRAASGSVRLDFTEAVITQPVLTIDAEVSSGQLTLITRPGIAVDTSDVVVRSGSTKVREPWGSQAQVRLRIEVTGNVGSGHITARPPRRTFWQWLLRRPGRYWAESG